MLEKRVFRLKHIQGRMIYLPCFTLAFEFTFKSKFETNIAPLNCFSKIDISIKFYCPVIKMKALSY